MGPSWPPAQLLFLPHSSTGFLCMIKLRISSYLSERNLTDSCILNPCKLPFVGAGTPLASVLQRLTGEHMFLQTPQKLQTMDGENFATPNKWILGCANIECFRASQTHITGPVKVPEYQEAVPELPGRGCTHLIIR